MSKNRSIDATRRDEGSPDLVLADGGSCLQRAYREMLETTVILVSLSTVAGVTLIYAITGPLSIENTLPVGGRLLYVGLCGLICWPLCQSLSTTLLYFTRRSRPHQIVLVAIAGVAFMALVCSAVAYTVFGIAGKRYAGGFADIYLSALLAVAACSIVVHYTACLRARLRYAAEAAAAAMSVRDPGTSSPETAGSGHAPDSGDVIEPRDRLEPLSNEADRTPGRDPRDRISTRVASDETPASTAPVSSAPHRSATGSRAGHAGRPRFLDRLPGHIGHDVVYLNVSGHYVNAVTTEGSGVILMRFADAIAELDDVGVQIHRSYWVAHRHITAIFRRDERTLVRVTGGHELPVSRTYLTAVRALIPHVADQRQAAQGQDTGSPPAASPASDSLPRGDIEPRRD